MERVIGRAREETETEERKAVSEEVDRLVRESGLTRAELAPHIGTSASRLSTYATGKVMPSAALMILMRRVGAGTGFAFLAGAWRDQVRIADDFDELPPNQRDSEMNACGVGVVW